jgi:hypothetical protein
VQHAGTTEGGETVGGSANGSQLSPSGRSAEMISNGRSDTDRMVLIKGVREHVAANGPSMGTSAAGDQQIYRGL